MLKPTNPAKNKIVRELNKFAKLKGILWKPEGQLSVKNSMERKFYVVIFTGINTSWVQGFVVTCCYGMSLFVDKNDK